MRANIISIASFLGLALGQSCPDSSADGFASYGDGTTGGGDATPTTVTTLDELQSAVSADGPAVIVVDGTIDTGGEFVSITSDKTVVGANAKATIIGGFNIKRVSNIIIRNLNIDVSNGPVDGIASRLSDHIWYDHLNIHDASDGLLDITKQSDFQTVSWCRFSYKDTKNDHRLASLNSAGGGSQPDDEGKLHVTYHHNHWAENVDQRMPRVMYGEGHQYNNYFNSPGNTYCIGFGSYASVLIENNYFKDVKNPHHFQYNVYAYAAAEGNIYDGTTGTKDVGVHGSEDVAGQEGFTYDPVKPTYKYTLDDAKSIPDLVSSCAGPRDDIGSAGSSPSAGTTGSSPSAETPSSSPSATESGSEESNEEEGSAATEGAAEDDGSSEEKVSPVEEEGPAEEPTETEPAETEPAETEPAETEPAETEPAETEPAETEPAETEPAEKEPAEEEPAETEPAETEPAEKEPAEEEPAETEPTEMEPTETEPAEKEPAEEEPAEGEPTMGGVSPVETGRPQKTKTPCPSRRKHKRALRV